MTEDTPAAQALASLALSSSLMEALLKRGVIEGADADDDHPGCCQLRRRVLH